MLGVDYSTRLTPAQLAALRALGVGFVCRYYGDPTWPKVLTREEALEIGQAGLRIVSVFETDPTSPAYFSAQRGIQDAQLALQCAHLVQQPAGVIFATVDFDAQPADMPTIREYLTAFRSTLQPHYGAGVYGSHAVIAAAADLSVARWQTMAWSGGLTFSPVDFVQVLNGINLAGASVDIDVALTSLSGSPLAWFAGVSPAGPAPAPVEPAPTSAVQDLQQLVNTIGLTHLTVDGIYGPLTANAAAQALLTAKGWQANYRTRVLNTVTDALRSIR